MDAFIDRVIEQFRKRVWELLARGPGTAAGARDEARRVHRQLRDRDWRDLTRDPEAHVFIAVADVLQAFNPPGKPEKSARTDLAVARSHAAPDACEINECAAMIQPIVSRLRDGLADLPPLCRAALILHRRDRLSLEEIANRLHLQVAEVRQHLKTGILHCAAGRLYNLK